MRVIFEVWVSAPDLLGSGADSVPVVSEIVAGSSSHTCPHSGRSRWSEWRWERWGREMGGGGHFM